MVLYDRNGGAFQAEIAKPPLLQAFQELQPAGLGAILIK